MVYHAWDDQNEPRYGANPLGRTLRIDRLTWRGDTPVMDGPTVTHAARAANRRAGAEKDGRPARCGEQTPGGQARRSRPQPLSQIYSCCVSSSIRLCTRALAAWVEDSSQM